MLHAHHHVEFLAQRFAVGRLFGSLGGETLEQV